MATARRRAGLAAALGVVALAVLGYAAFEFSGQVTCQRSAGGRETAGHAAPRQPHACRHHRRHRDA
jgi:hypothetical protein